MFGPKVNNILLGGLERDIDIRMNRFLFTTDSVLILHLRPSATQMTFLYQERMEDFGVGSLCKATRILKKNGEVDEYGW